MNHELNFYLPTHDYHAVRHELTIVVEIGEEYFFALHVGSVNYLVGTVDNDFELVIFIIKLDVFNNAVIFDLVWEVEVAAAEKRLRFTELHQRLDHVYAVVEFSRIDLIPRHAASAVGIGAAVHTVFCAVIETRTARHGKENGELRVDDVHILLVTAEDSFGVV